MSRNFMVGVAEIADPVEVAHRLDALRSSLMADPYFTGVPSMHPGGRKTALAFHAKDDLPEVRRHVFHLLRACDIRVAVAVRRKAAIAAHARASFAASGVKWQVDDVYDALVTHLFIGRLRDDARHHVTFAVRKTATRDAALTHALERARLAQGCAAHCVVASDRPSGAPGLQVIDYYLWAIQRLYERGEERFWAAVAPQIEYVWDMDDPDAGPGGTKYTAESRPSRLVETRLPLTSARFEG